MEKIESAQNKRIKWIASLKNARRRREEGVVVAEGVRLLAADLDEAAQPYYAADYSGRLALAFGNEGNGVSDEVRRMAEAKLFIPMFGKAESLNVATAAALVLYEAAGVRRGFRRHCQ